MFTKERIKFDFVKEIYQYFIDAGFDFNGVYIERTDQMVP